MHAADMGYWDGKDKDAKLQQGCKYAFGCALLFVFLLVITMPFSGVLVWLELNSWGL